MFTSRDKEDLIYNFQNSNLGFTRVSEDSWRVSSILTDEFDEVADYVNSTRVSILESSDNVDILFVDSAEAIPVHIHDEILKEFASFKLYRPEYLVGKIHTVDGADSESLIDLYERLILGCALLRASKNKQNVDINYVLSKVDSCLEWLRNGDFYDAPASSIYHESYRGGLLRHTLNVVNIISDLIQVNKFKSVAIEDAVLVALIHDWCKIGLYESYLKNVKNETTGQWEKVEAYKRKEPAFPLGHGAASLFLSRSFFKLSLGEALAVRWHMGEYNVAPNEMNELHAANEHYPLVQLLQFADRLSITSY